MHSHNWKGPKWEIEGNKVKAIWECSRCHAMKINEHRFRKPGVHAQTPERVD